MMNSLWSTLYGKIETDLKLTEISFIPLNENNKKLTQILCHCLRTSEIPLYNNEPLKNSKTLITNTIYVHNNLEL